jgi:LmbE family N-acetylglucosaminyl deacetylase
MRDITAIRRALIIAPHPDDESLGCGGLVALLSQRGCELAVIFVTDGGSSHTLSRAWPRERLVARRRAEANAALLELGLADAQRLFLNLPDAGMPSPGSQQWHRAVARVSSAVQKLRPELVVAPWRRDPHCDHRAAWQMAHEALRPTSPRPLMLEYAIWLDEFGAPGDSPQPSEVEAIAIDITQTLAAKKRAIAMHRTQTTALIDDDPSGFRLSAATIERLTGPIECYWRSRDAAD